MWTKVLRGKVEEAPQINKRPKARNRRKQRKSRCQRSRSQQAKNQMSKGKKNGETRDRLKKEEETDTREEERES